MQRITGADVAANLHGTGKHGFKERVPGVSGPTIVTAAFANNVQEELCRTVEGYGFNLGTSNHQLLNVAKCAAIESSIINHVPRAPANSYPSWFNTMSVSTTGLIVAGGYIGEIQTSPDGATWTKRTQAGGYGNGNGDYFVTSIYSAALGLFVLGGTNGEIQTSPDGITWTKRTQAASFAGRWTGATYGNGLFVLVGDAGEIQTSPNGVTWTKRTQAASFAFSFRGLAFGAGLFVAVGDTGEIQTSPDGITWTKRTPASLYACMSVAYDNGLFVAVGLYGQIQASSDGINWTLRHASTPLHILFVCAGGGYFFGGGYGGLLVVSADGVDWRVVHRPGRFSSPSGWVVSACFHPQTSTFLMSAYAETGFRQTLAI